MIAYVAKYASKGETTSSSYEKTLQTAISKLKDGDAAGIAYQKMLSTFTAERDISGQETCHILLGCSLVQSSRLVRNLNVSPHLSEEVDFANLTKERKGLVEHYKLRPEDLEDVTLLEFATWYDFKGGRYTRRGKQGALSYVVNIWP